MTYDSPYDPQDSPPQSDLPIRLSDNELSRMVSGTGKELEPYSPPRDLGFDYPEPSSGFSLRDICYVIFRHKWKIAISFLLLSTLSALFVAAQPDLFESTAEVFLGAERQDWIISPDPNAPFEQSRGAGNRVRAEIAIISGLKVAEAVVDKVGVDRLLQPAEAGAGGITPASTGGNAEANAQTPSAMQRGKSLLRQGIQQVKTVLNLSSTTVPRREQAIRMVQDNLSIRETMAGSSVLRLTFIAQSPKIAQEALATLVEEYQKEHIKAHELPISLEDFQKQVDQSSTKLAAKRTALDQKKAEFKITSVDHQRTRLYGKLYTFDTNLSLGKGLVAAHNAKINILESLLNTRAVDDSGNVVASTASDREFIQRLRASLNEARMREAELLGRYEETSYFVIEERKLIKNFEELLAKSQSGQQEQQVVVNIDGVAQALEQTLQTTKATLAAQEAQNKVYASDLKALSEEITTFEENQQIIVGLEQEIAQLDSQYQQQLLNLEFYQRNKNLDQANISNVSVTQEATLPYKTEKSNRKMLAILAFGMFMGLAAGIGLAFTLDFFNHSLKTNEDVEKWLGLPVLTTLPKVRKHQPETKVIV